MHWKISELTRKVGLYGPLRAVKSRVDRLRSENIRHRRLALEFYGNFFGPGDLVFDVGANVGNRTDIFLDLGATVVAVEPQPPCQDVLKRLFGENARFTLVSEALGATAGEAEMFVSDALVLSTLSAEWVAKMRDSGRFGEVEWNQLTTVAVKTLDSLVAEHGQPAFCKIDVEGFELDVVRGLSSPVRALSLEVAAENIDGILLALDHLDRLASYEYNYSLSESMLLSMDRWVTSQEVRQYIRAELGAGMFGDVYARRAA
jgi:FkbM family methyltransferase